MTIKVRLLFALLAMVLLPLRVFAADEIPSDTAAVQQVEDALTRWLTAVESGDAHEVTALYERDAILLPTLSPVVADTPEARETYFKKFVSHADLKGKIDEEHIRVWDKVAVNSGLYTFTFVSEGKRVSVPARFTFVYEKTPYGWMIVDHHSSKLPQD